MYLRTYFDKDTTIVKDSTVNLGANPIAELFYGGGFQDPQYSRYLFRFPIDGLKEKYQNCELGDLSKVRHTLKLTPIRSLGSFKNKDACLASSYKLCLFPITQDWTEGCGYDKDCVEDCSGYVSPNCNNSNGAANWYYAKDGELWEEEGVFDTLSGDTVYLDCVEQNCDDCTVEFDMTVLVNHFITGDTENFGFGIAYHSEYEIDPPNFYTYLGFYSRETPNFYEPFLETVYENPIEDDRNQFYQDKVNKLYLYSFLRGEPKNLDTNPIVNILDPSDNVYLTLTGECVDKGVYAVEFTIPSTGDTQCAEWIDKWYNISVDGVQRPDVEQYFYLKPSEEYYNIGLESYTPKRFGFSFRGIKRNEFIQRGGIRKVFVDTKQAFNTLKKVVLDNLYYRLYVKEGLQQVDVIPWSPVNRSFCDNYVYLDTFWLIPQNYYLDFKAVSNGEERTYPEEIKFVVIEDDKACKRIRYGIE